MASLPFDHLFGKIVADIEDEMRAVRVSQREVAPILWQIVDYHFGWDQPVDATGRHPNVSGKKVRPLLMALVGKAITGGYEHVLPAGAALELTHNFTLLHDDVMDKSELRRHRPAVWTRWGSAQAINAGDGLYALAFLAMGRLRRGDVRPAKVARAYEALAAACLATAEGQILDIDFETRDRVTPDEYITMISHKSGALIEAATKIGALLSTDDENVINSYAKFGRNLGIGFQIWDDYLGVWGDEASTGKSATSDIREKKKSHPILLAFERASDEDRATLSRIYAQDALSDADLEAVLAILERVGARQRCAEIAEEYYELALAHLAATGIQNPTQNQLRQLAAFLIQRTY